MKEYETILWVLTVIAIILMIVIIVIYIGYRIDANQYLIDWKEKMNSRMNEWILSRYVENGVMKTTRYMNKGSLSKYFQTFE